MKPRRAKSSRVDGWTAAELRVLRARFGRDSHAALGRRLNRTASAVQTKGMRLGLRTSRRHWAAGELAVLRANAGKLTAAAIGRLLDRSADSVENQIHVRGLSKPQRKLSAAELELLASRHAQQWSDSEIAAELNVCREAVTKWRRKFKLPANGNCERRRRKVAERTAAQCCAAGVRSLGDLRAKLWADQARAHARGMGWPEDLQLRAVQILNALWDRGPMTRKEIAAAIGMPTAYPNAKNAQRSILKSNGPGGSYLATLIARGLVIRLPRACRMVGQGKGHSCDVYTLPVTIQRRAVS